MTDRALKASDYDRIDGKNAYKSKIKKLTLGKAIFEENKDMEIATQIWEENSNGELEISKEIPVHQVFDLMIFLLKSMLYFKEAYRIENLYDEKNPIIDRLGLQGDAMQIEVDLDNPNLKEDIREFADSLGNLGEITGERLRVLTRLIEELELY